MAFFAFEPDNQSLNLGRERIGVMHRPAGAILKRSQPFLLAAIEDLVAGLPRYPELQAQIGHRFALDQTGDDPQTFFHCRTLFPWHPTPPAKSRKT
jgi:hypothetical protein